MGRYQTRLPTIEEERLITAAVHQASIFFASSGGGGSSSSTASYTPTLIDTGETFTVPANKQVLYALTITVAGTLAVHGSLIMVN